jgi:hypothetical protein
MRYWNWEMLGTLNRPGGSKGKMKLGAEPGSSAHTAVPPVETVPPVGTEVPLPDPPDPPEDDDEQAASRSAAAIATAPMERVARVRLTASSLSAQPPTALAARGDRNVNVLRRSSR